MTVSTKRILIVGALLLVILLRFFPPFVEQHAHVKPPYPQKDLSALLHKETLTQKDYQVLYEQTGLGKTATEKLLQAKDGEQRLLYFQEKLFAAVDFVCEPNSIISNEERLVANGKTSRGTSFADLENGYVLVTKASHTFSWRNGHAAIVVDAENRQTLESVVLGTNSCLQDINKWLNYPNFMILRLKHADSLLLEEIASFAKTYLNDIPYSFTPGVFRKKYELKAEISGTQCAHLIWRAFREFGYDVDSDQGGIVTPKDLANSPFFEVVQVYGMNPHEPWP